jgi:DNA-binding CsgD family transcriptional regulator
MTSQTMTRTDTSVCAVGLVDLDDGSIASISQTWLDHLGMPAESVVGRPGIDLVRYDKAAAAQALALMRDGSIRAFVARGELNEPIRSEAMSTIWVRPFEIGGRHLALVQAAPASDDTVTPIAKHLGYEPATMAIGSVDGNLIITAMSSDIADLLGVSPNDLVGQPLPSLVAGRDVGSLLTAGDRPGEHAGPMPLHLRNSDGDWVELWCVLATLAGTPDRCIVLSLAPERDEPASRVAELEHHLWSIAAIVEATGVLQRVGAMRDLSASTEANHLTTRQWEVLARIVRGERVPSIAADLHVSQSTVRNHLSAIFKRFGVHSQPELLRIIDARPTNAQGDGPDAAANV